MRKTFAIAASLSLASAFAPQTLSAQTSDPCYEAYQFNSGSCEEGNVRCQLLVDRLYQECLRTGVVEYI